MFTKGSLDFVKLVPYALLVIAASAELCQVQSTSPTCSLLHQIEQSLDETTNPCENFYGHVCNRFWPQHNSSHYQMADHQMNLNLITVMETLYPQPLPNATGPDQDIFDKSYIYYKACVQEEGSSNVLRYLEFVKPGKDLEWPLVEELQAYREGNSNFVVNQWPEGQFDVFALLGQLQSYGLNNVLIYQRLPDADSPLTMGRPIIEKKHSFSLSVLNEVLVGWGLPEETALKYAEDVVDTEKYWHSLYQNQTLELQNELLSYRRLQQQFPYLSVFMEHTFQHKFRDSFRIELYNTGYFQFLGDKQWTTKEAQDICNYLMVRFLVHLQETKAKDFSQLECIKDVKSNLEMPVNLLYYQYIYQPDEMIYNREIYAFFKKTLQYAMDDLQENNMNLTTSLLDELLANMSSITLNIGNLPRNLRTSQIEKFYRNIPALEHGNYYRNHLHLLRHGVLKSLLPLKHQTYTIVRDFKEVLMSVPFYDQRIHMVVIPFSVIQPPIYHHTYDPIFKWSNLGQQLAFDITSSVLRNIFILEAGGHPQSPDVIQKLEARTVFAAGFLSIQVAYNAYINEQRAQLQPEFTSMAWQKLFLLNLSQQWCGPPESARMALMSRIFQIAIQMDIFSEAFQCNLE